MACKKTSSELLLSNTPVNDSQINQVSSELNKVHKLAIGREVVCPDVEALAARVDQNAEDISDLKEDFNYVDDFVGLLPASWEMGGMFAATGIEYNSTTRIRTLFLKVAPNQEVVFNGTYNSNFLIFEFANNTETASGVNERLSQKTLGYNYPVVHKVGASTNYIRLQLEAESPAIGRSLIVSVKNNLVLIDALKTRNDIPNGTDANDLKGSLYNGIYVINSTSTYTNLPINVGILIVCQISASVTLQIAISWADRQPVYKRTCLTNTWSNWGQNLTTDSLSDFMVAEKTALTETDLNKVFGESIWLMSDSYVYTNKPAEYTSNAGFLLVAELSNGWTLQVLWQFSGNKMWKRRGKNETTPIWEDWQQISGSGNTYNITNNNTFEEYSQTVALTASPQITSDTNNYLAPSGDTSDRTSDIMTMLNSNGICRLGAGTYYVKNLQMPEGSSIIGSGYSTKVVMSTGDGFAIKMTSFCTVKDLQIVGNESDLSFTSTEGGRHGILWQGTYTADNHAPYRSIVSGLYIRGFTGGGIRCYDTGYGTSNALEATNIYIWNCWAGLDINYWSEFHKFTNVRCGQCRIGCVNNGGNNIFVNCDFSSNYEIAMLMDNSQGQSPNNTHGSCIGCVFNHTQHDGQSNSGIGVEILNCANGFVFDGCQIFFSKIHLEDSNGITFSNCNFGYSNCDIDINGGGAILFIGNQHQQKAPISISNNQNVYFVNCYRRDTGAIIEP